MEEKTEVKVEKINWFWVIPLSVAFVVLIHCGYAVLPIELTSIYNLDDNLYIMMFRSAPLMIFMLLFISRSFLKFKISRSTLAFVYVVFAISSISGSYGWPWAEGWASYVLVRLTPATSKFLPLLWFPSEEIVTPMLLGGVSVPWGNWVTPIAFWTILHTSIYLFLVSIDSIFRRQWIDVEQVPYPYVIVSYTALEVVSSSNGSSSEKSKIFLYGFIVGFLIYLLPILNLAFPQIPDIYGWRTNPIYDYSTQGAFSAPRVFPALASVIVGFNAVQTNPGAIVLAFLAPMHTLISVVFFSILFVLIIPQIAYQFGYYTGIFSTMTTGSRILRIFVEPPFKYEAMNYGVLSGILFFWIILNWKYLSETFKIAIGKIKAEEIESKEPLTYRQMYLILVISVVLLILLFMMSGIEFAAAILMPISMFIICIGGARCQALAGPVPGGFTFGHTLYRFLWPAGTITEPTQSFVLAMNFSRKYLVENYFPSPSAWVPLESYKMGSLTGVDYKNIFKIMTVVFILGTPVALITVLTLFYSIGFNKLPQALSGCYNHYSDAINLSYVYTLPGPDPILPNVIGGFILCGIISFLHSRFVWFPFEPVGLALSLNRPFQKAAFWQSFAVALILKYAVLKIGGAKVYEKYGVPFAAGYMGGFTINVILGMAVGILRFFFPA